MRAAAERQGKAGRLPISRGDLLAGVVEDPSDDTGQPILLGSFHGDTDGLATIPTLKAVATVWGERAAAALGGAGPRLLFGLDANTYEHAGDQSDGKKKRQSVGGFADAFRGHGLTSCWGARPDPASYTTYNARTYLQPQLNKVKGALPTAIHRPARL